MPTSAPAPSSTAPDVGLEVASPAELDAAEARIDAVLRRMLAESPVVDAVERGEPGERRWYVRIRGEEKDASTIWFTLRQRTLHHECYVLPAPEEDHARFYEHLLRRNLRLFGVHFAIGAEDAVFLVGALAIDDVDDESLDRVVGTVYATVEQCFRPALRIGFASRFRG